MIALDLIIVNYRSVSLKILHYAPGTSLLLKVRSLYFLALKRDETIRIVALRDAGHSWNEIFKILDGSVSLSVI